jgi:hypothetical protein
VKAWSYLITNWCQKVGQGFALEWLFRRLKLKAPIHLILFFACLAFWTGNSSAIDDLKYQTFSPRAACRETHSIGRGWVVISHEDAFFPYQDQLFVGVKNPGRAVLLGSFSTLYEGNAFFSIPGDHEHNPFHFSTSMDFLISRGDFWNNQWYPHTPYRRTFRTPEPEGMMPSALGWIRPALLNDLYGAYEGQGPERNTEIQTYQQEDAETIHRSTSFILLVDGQPTIHLQALMSRNAQYEPLNLERHFPHFKVPRDGRPIFEIGRLFFSKSILARLAAKDLAADNPAIILQVSLYQKLFSWLNRDVQAGTVLMQVNDPVYKVLHSEEIDLVFSKEESVIGPTGAREWILTMDRQAMLKSEENLMRSILINRIKKELGRHKVPTEQDGMTITFYLNEKDVLRRLGLVSTEASAMAPATYIPADIFEDSNRDLSLGFKRSAAMRVLNYLQNLRHADSSTAKN